MARRKATERTIAAVLSVTLHGLVLWMLASGLRRDPPLPAADVIELMLQRPANAPPPPRRKPEPDFRPPAPAAKDDAASSAPAALETVAQSSGVPVGGPSVPTGGEPSPAPQALKFTCVTDGLKTLTPAQRRACLGQAYAAPDPTGRFDTLMIPADKRKQYDAVARRQASIRRKPSQLGNGASMGCPHANLGSGCLDDMLLPVVSTGGGGTTVGAK